MKQPDQQIHDAIMEEVSKLGLKVYPTLPDLGTAYPFIVMGDTHLLPRPTKSRMIGSVAVDIHVWGSFKDRRLVSDTLARVMEVCSHIKRPDSRQWSMDLTSDTQLLKDNSTPEVLYHGVADVTFRFL